MSWFQKYTPSFSKAGSAIKSAGAWDVGDAAYSAAKTTTDYAARSITGTARLFSAIGVGAYQAASKPVGDGGLLIFFVSLLIYLFEMFYVPLTSFGEFYALKLPLSIALFIIAIVLVQRKSGIVLGGMVIFWYFYDGSFISFSSVSLPEFIINPLKFLAPYVISYALLMILFSFIGRLGKAQNTGVVELVANDIGGFLVPFIILLLDIGFASYIGTAFNLDVLSTVVESLFLNIPIWAMYGLIKSESESPIIHLLRNASVLYVVAILIMGIIPLLPQVTGTPNVSDPSELIKAQQEKRAQLPEHILISQLLCIGTTQYGSIPECVKQRQAESKCKDVSKTGTPEEYAECLAIARGDKAQITIGGVNDPTFGLPTSFTITPGEGFLQRIDPTEAQPFLLIVQNPREQEIEFEVVCSYSAGEQTLEVDKETVTITGDNSEPYAFFCRSDLPSGAGKWVVSATAKKLQTVVGLERAFIGENNELAEQIKTNFFSGDASRPRGPLDPARLDFAIGQPPLDPIIKQRDVQLIATVKNNAGGEITNVYLSSIFLRKDIFLPETTCELTFDQSSRSTIDTSSLDSRYGSDSDILFKPNFNTKGKEKQKEIRYGLCTLTLSEAYRFPDLPILEYFQSYIEYDYKITKEFPITVNKLE